MDNFGVIVENKNGKEIVDYLASKGYIHSLNGDASNDSYYYIAKNCNKVTACYHNYTDSEYTLQELKRLLDEPPIHECW